jgi:hypothetical protein
MLLRGCELGAEKGASSSNQRQAHHSCVQSEESDKRTDMMQMLFSPDKAEEKKVIRLYVWVGKSWCFS